MGDRERLSVLPYDELGAVGEYLLDCRDRNLSPRTIVLKYQRLAAMRQAVGVPLEQLDEDGARRWWRGLTKRGVTPQTRGIYLSHARSFYTWACREDVVSADPTRKLMPPKRRVGTPRDLDPNAVLGVIGRVPVAQVRLAMCLMLWGGLRCAEVAECRGQDVVTRGAGEDVLKVSGKGGRERVVKLPAWLAEAVRARGQGWTFASGRREGPVAPGTVGRWVSDALRAGGVQATAHQLRHTNATQIYMAHPDPLALQGHLGHATLATVQVYARSAGMASSLVAGLFGGGRPPALDEAAIVSEQLGDPPAA
jgi:integrase/recombinase XerC